MTVQGGIQALLGGKFKDGAIAGFASGLAELTSANIGTSIKQAVDAGTMSATEALAARTFNTLLSSAIRAAGSPGDPAHAFASDWLNGLMTEFMPAPVQGEGPWSSVEHRNGSDIEDDRAGEVHTFPVPAPAPLDAQPLPPVPPDLSLITPRPEESDSQFTVRLMREIYGSDVDLSPFGEHNRYRIYRDDDGRLVITDGTGLNPPVDPKVVAAFEALLAQRAQQLNAITSVQRSQAFREWAAANDRPIELPSEPGLLDRRIPVVADVRDFLLAQIDHAVANTTGGGQVALEGLRIAVEALTPETYADAALNELGAGIVKAGVPLAGALKAAAMESRLGKEVSELLHVASREGADVAGHLIGNAAEAEARAAGRTVLRETPGRTSEWNSVLNRDLVPDATYVLANGHSYTTDALRRVVKAEGDLVALIRSDRNLYQQVRTGQIGGEGYEGGHLIGSLFGGAGEKINLVPQLSSVNRGDYRAMERVWAEAIREGKQVKVEVRPLYSADARVPAKIEVKYWIDGQPTIREFKNTRG